MSSHGISFSIITSNWTADAAENLSNKLALFAPLTTAVRHEELVQH
jgi:hypothetical protein